MPIFLVQEEFVDKAGFFRFFRNRLRNIRLLGEFDERFDVEQHVSLAAALDSLAAYWERIEAKKAKNGRKRMQRFLATHAQNNIWSRCCFVDLLFRATKLQPNQQKALNEALSRRPQMFEVVTFEIDPYLDELVNSSLLQRAKIDREWLEHSNYAQLFYKEYRNSWLHALDPGMKIDESAFRDVPYYHSFRGKHELVLPKQFIVETLATVLDSLEKTMPDDIQICLD